MPRIDIILLAYRKSLEWLEQARHAIADGERERATPLLSRTQLVISSLAAGLAGAADDVSLNFLRLYEFAANAIAKAEVVDIDAARSVLRTLMEGFEAAREQAIALEAQGTIPPLGRDHTLQVTV
jgi:flagellin-specific chaperone FliS